MEAIVKSLKGLAALAHKSAPYLLLEILLPGGTLFALLLFLHRSRSASGPQEGRARVATLMEQAIDRVRDALAVAPPHDIVAVSAEAANDDGLAPLAMAPGR